METREALSFPTSLLATAFALVFLWAAARRHRQGSKRYPPGPKGRPFVGNLADMPEGGNEWDEYAKIAKQHGMSFRANAIHSSLNMTLIRFDMRSRGRRERRGGVLQHARHPRRRLEYIRSCARSPREEGRAVLGPSALRDVERTVRFPLSAYLYHTLMFNFVTLA